MFTTKLYPIIQNALPVCAIIDIPICTTPLHLEGGARQKPNSNIIKTCSSDPILGKLFAVEHDQSSISALQSRFSPPLSPNLSYFPYCTEGWRHSISKK